MGLPIYVDFAPFTDPAVPKSRSLALAKPAVDQPLVAHVHIGRFSTELARQVKANRSVLLDKGTTTCPCELDLAYTEIAAHIQDEGSGADVFIEPLRDDTGIQLDVLLQRSEDGKSWKSEPLLTHCCCVGVVRTAEIPELGGDRARIQIRVTSPKTPSALVRIWANEPRKPAMHVEGR